MPTSISLQIYFFSLIKVRAFSEAEWDFVLDYIISSGGPVSLSTSSILSVWLILHNYNSDDDSSFFRVIISQMKEYVVWMDVDLI